MTVLHAKVTSLYLELLLLIYQLLPIVQDPSIDFGGDLDLLEPNGMESWDNLWLVEVCRVDVEDSASRASVPALCLVCKSLLFHLDQCKLSSLLSSSLA